MWKKSDNEYPDPLDLPLTDSFQVGREQAIIGPSITIKGDLSGEEDLIIQGKVDGTIQLSDHNVTVGIKGRVNADIYAKGIKIEGEVRGNLLGSEQVFISKTGHVRGNVSAPNVALEEGCQFKGSIDMEKAVAAKDTSKQMTANQQTLHKESSKSANKAVKEKTNKSALDKSERTVV